jgi:hypothetical protein
MGGHLFIGFLAGCLFASGLIGLLQSYNLQ